jgi:hypothetical protein
MTASTYLRKIQQIDNLLLFLPQNCISAVDCQESVENFFEQP